MRFAIVLALAACGGAPAKPAATAAPPPTNVADLEWLAGGWRGDGVDEYFAKGVDAYWGVRLSDSGFAVLEIDKPKDRLELLTVTDGKDAQTIPLTYAGFQRLDFGVSDRVVFVRTDEQFQTELQHGTDKPHNYTAAGIPASHDADALAAADSAFAADSAVTGSAAWLRALAPGGALWRRGKRVEGEAIRAVVDGMLAKGKLAWAPVASGVRGDRGFTVGTYTYDAGGTVSKGSYCTIWQRVDGAWRMAFDIGN